MNFGRLTHVSERLAGIYVAINVCVVGRMMDQIKISNVLDAFMKM